MDLKRHRLYEARAPHVVVSYSTSLIMANPSVSLLTSRESLAEVRESKAGCHVTLMHVQTKPRMRPCHHSPMTSMCHAFSMAAGGLGDRSSPPPPLSSPPTPSPSRLYSPSIPPPLPPPPLSPPLLDVGRKRRVWSSG